MPTAIAPVAVNVACSPCRRAMTVHNQSLTAITELAAYTVQSASAPRW